MRAAFVVAMFAGGAAFARGPKLADDSFAGSPLPIMGMLALMAVIPFIVVMLTLHALLVASLILFTRLQAG